MATTNEPTIYRSVNELVVACKDRGVTLYSRGQTLHHDRVHEQGGERLVQLQQAVAVGSNVIDAMEIDGVTPRPSDLWISYELCIGPCTDALQDESSDLRRVSTVPIERTFVYVDVSDFSKHKAGQQALIINSLVTIVRRDGYWRHAESMPAKESLEAMLCIGDGYIFVLLDPLQATYFAAFLAELIEVLGARGRFPVPFHFRSGVHVGPVYCFWDWGRNGWNYIGDGINGGQRVLGAIGKDADDIVFISGQVWQKITATQRDGSMAECVLGALQNRGRRADKHGNPWRVYEVNHTQLAGSLARHLVSNE
jgi:class 3 adenylate cyclase